MPYAIALPLEGPAVAAVERIHAALARNAGDLPPSMPPYRPHVTLALFDASGPLTPIARAVERIAQDHPPVPIILSGFGVFPGAPPVLWAVPVPTAGLLALHQHVRSALHPWPVHPHYEPDAWIPHVTLAECRDRSSGDLMRAVVESGSLPVEGTATELDVLKFFPIEILATLRLRTAATSSAPT